jgi:hypothetical protein
MHTVPLDLAFSRFGANVTTGKRPLCATAQDGSLVLVCLSSGFSRPDPGVLRYSAQLSLILAGSSQIAALRLSLDAAFSGGTAVRLIIRTPSTNGYPAAVHMRADLVGSVTAFDGDAYRVDFVRLPMDDPGPPSRARRRRQ